MVDFDSNDEYNLVKKHKIMLDLLLQIATIETELNLETRIEKALKSIENLHHE